VEKEIQCPWCGEMTVPNVKLEKRKLAEVRERRCSKCNKVLAAYLDSEGDFFKKIRTF
jgi:phage FluMu protein Com